ncbi:MAG TPA: aminopeptidase [Thermoplasmata archaeon]|nr:aminopeptidase [Thermoplasmata archaeon]
MASAQQLAKSIVQGSLRPKEFEAVLIACVPHTMELAEQVAIECQRAGADPGLWLDTDAVFYGQFKNYPLDNLRRVSAHCLGLLNYMDSYVWLGGVRDPSGMARVPRERWAAYSEGEQAHSDKSNEKKTKNVGVGLGLLTRERAKAYGLNYATWKTQMEAAIAVNYGQLETLGRTVAGLLEQPVGVRVTADNGTDLRFRLAGGARRAHVNDGAISEEDIAAGNWDANLPAGSVEVAPVEESANGTFVANAPTPQYGKLIEGMAWNFRNGRVVDFAAKKNLALAQTGWETATGQKDMLGTFGLGLNRKAKPGFLNTGIVAGSATLSIGENRSSGGTNRSSFAAFGFETAATVEVAGKTIVQDGKWVI